MHNYGRARIMSSDELRTLAEHREEGPHVSVFMPAARAGAEIQQGPIRFKNLLKGGRISA